MPQPAQKESTSSGGFSVVSLSATAFPVDAPKIQLDINACNKKLSTEGGLSPEQIHLAVQNLDIPNAKKDPYSVTTDGMLPIPYDVYKNINAKIVVIGRILNLNESALVENSIGIDQVVSVINEIKKNRISPVDSIQLIVAVKEKGRKHYVQLEIFKKDDNTIAARIIDSTSNPIAIPVKKVRDLLVKLGTDAQLHNTLGLNSTGKATVTEVHTGIQSVIGDERCALYTLGGIAASMKMMFAKGVKQLTSDSEAERIAKAEHDCVKKSLPENYLQSRLVSTVFEKQNAEYKTLSDAINNMDKNKLNTVVKASLKNYLANRGKFGSIFRQLSSVGADYALNAKARIDGTRTVDDEPAVSKQIAMEILEQGMKTDGIIEVKQNSRVLWLLTELKNQGLINKDVTAGSSNKVNDLFSAVNNDDSLKSFSSRS